MGAKIDTKRLLEEINLLDLVTTDLGPGKASGRWHMWRCPFHEDNDPSFGVHTDGRFYCFGCGVHGDAISYIMKRHNLTFRDACDRLGAPGYAPPLMMPRPAPNEDPPGADWRTLAGEIVREASERLMHAPEAKQARDYLAGRGIKLSMARAARLGYVPGRVKDRWPTLHGLKVPPGILIPWFDHTGTLWRVNVRRPTQRKGERYRNIAGGSPHGLYIAAQEVKPGAPLLVVEGEFDALVAYQTVGDVLTVVTLGGAAKALPLRWLPIFAAAPVILAAHDTDQAGDDAAAKLGALSARVKRLDLPAGKDITEYVTGGGDLRGLVEACLAAPKEPVVPAEPAPVESLPVKAAAPAADHEPAHDVNPFPDVKTITLNPQDADHERGIWYISDRRFDGYLVDLDTPRIGQFQWVKKGPGVKSVFDEVQEFEAVRRRGAVPV